MRFVVIFEEGAEMVPVREAHEPAHLAFLEKHQDDIKMAGGLRNEHGGPYVGGQWVFEVPSRERAIELMELDPYFQANPRRDRLLGWGKALHQVQGLMSIHCGPHKAVRFSVGVPSRQPVAANRCAG